ncbi:acrylyl-CoA reductase (NADPH) [Novacetimonas pomaceti]|uniref:Oxidoreductase n=1 Tax=Novacetimonas pomaceti TaxID=2021998 RepID=A0ABX5P0F3_9PROT|nr:MDR family oxidoreductase [Novacetimonas pomaceti]MBV1833356.1 oxidoreductase [Novacetimonas pomaceti]PYD46926.1 oxidoreductase [Novacetimonas pomaceti]
MFNAIMIDKTRTGSRAGLRSVDPADLPEGEITVRVSYSSLNYKDALAITGRGPVVRQFPMIPGIDLAGEIISSADPVYRPGDQVIANGWGLGETHWGGLSQMARVHGKWLLPRPRAFSARQCMAIGTAGYTAMLCIMALEKGGIAPGDGDIVVTGAGGGVGSIAIALLARLGYRVVAVTGRDSLTEYLRRLGAAEVVGRSVLTHTGRPLQPARWSGAIDVAGGKILAALCATMRPGGVIAACGLAAGMDLPLTVAPFILRGITLHGIDSVMCPREQRMAAWARLERDLDPALVDSMCEEISLRQAITTAPQLLEGNIRGRLVVSTHNA